MIRISEFSSIAWQLGFGIHKNIQIEILLILHIIMIKMDIICYLSFGISITLKLVDHIIPKWKIHQTPNY